MMGDVAREVWVASPSKILFKRFRRDFGRTHAIIVKKFLPPFEERRVNLINAM